jgi:hypothetical protein
VWIYGLVSVSLCHAWNARWGIDSERLGRSPLLFRTAWPACILWRTKLDDFRKFELHPELAAWMDREANRIAGLIQDFTDKLPKDQGLLLHPDQPIAASFGPDDIVGEISASTVDLIGQIVARFYPHEDGVLGLDDSGMLEAQRIVDRIWSSRDLGNLLSRGTVLELLLEWVGSVVRTKTTGSFSDKIVRAVIETVTPVSILVPIDEVFVEGELSFATAVLSPLSRSQLDAAIETGTSQAPTALSSSAREKLYAKYLGKAVMRFELEAEPRRAQELAAERAADYMALLQFYAAPAMVLQLASHVAPTGARSYRTEASLAYAQGLFLHTERVTEPTYRLQITSAYRADMERLGLFTLSSLAENVACEYEAQLRRALLIYGRASYQLDPTGKLLQVMTAVEMFALRNESEPIMAALADRIAFAITNDPGTRQEIAQNLRAAYSERSGRSHHGKTIEDTETIEQFLRNAWAFFLTAIQGVGRYRTRMQFLDHLDRTKYGHG